MDWRLHLRRFDLKRAREIQLWLTNADKSALFELQKPSLQFSKSTDDAPTIEIDDQKTFQTIDGFGFALTGGSAQHLAHMDAAKRAALLKELFAVDGKNIGISYLRISIGSSDLNDHVFSYDDLAAGETDPTLAKFSLAPDRTGTHSRLERDSGDQPTNSDTGLAVVAARLDENK